MPDNNVSDEQFFQQVVERGFTTTLWPRMREIHRDCAAAVQSLGCDSVLEIGSGLGAFLLGCRDVGLDAIGFDRNPQLRKFAIENGVDPELYLLSDLSTFRIPNRFGTILSVEVFEHCSDAELDPICKQIAANCRWFYFTSTPDIEDEEWGHVNLKSRDGWIDFFSRYGLELDRPDTAIVPWGLLFRPAA